MSPEQFVDNLISGVAQGSVYALVGLGFTIIYTVTRIINFAQGEFVMLGGVFSFLLFSSVGLPLPLALLLAVLAATVVGAVLYLLAIRPARQASVISLIIITIGASTFIRGVVGQIWGKDYMPPLPHFSGDNQWLWIIGITLVVMVALHLFFSRTMMGKALKACSINRQAASLVGIDARSMAFTSFALAAALGAIGGAVITPLTAPHFRMGLTLGLKGFVAAAVGDFRSQVGTVVGGVILGIAEAMVVVLDWGPFASAYKDVIAMLVLLLVLFFRSSRGAAQEAAS
ncbi:MAG: branched-chain amino acid ABC transporter permease [Chloroflexi bacterium]|nr:MAG: branched-chain amino acid ABC transporter permease [Chloroflexota bacterium]RLC97476.1 MAG: branched-chain amino acid ABC transporter permease [Chloroflexota bacterium]